MGGWGVVCYINSHLKDKPGALAVCRLRLTLLICPPPAPPAAHSELDEALLVLPFDFVLRLVPYLRAWVDGSQMLEKSCRCIFFLLRCGCTIHAAPGLP